jgi:hypothetical protein
MLNDLNCVKSKPQDRESSQNNYDNKIACVSATGLFFKVLFTFLVFPIDSCWVISLFCLQLNRFSTFLMEIERTYFISFPATATTSGVVKRLDNFVFFKHNVCSVWPRYLFKFCFYYLIYFFFLLFN